MFVPNIYCRERGVINVSDIICDGLGALCFGTHLFLLNNAEAQISILVDQKKGSQLTRAP